MDRQPTVRPLLLLAVIDTSIGDIHTEHHPVWESFWLPHVLSTNSVNAFSRISILYNLVEAARAR